MKKIVIIPSHPLDANIKVRLGEIAKSMVPLADVYLVTWHSAQGRYSLINRAIACFKDIFAVPVLRKEGGLTKIILPLVHRPHWLARRINIVLLKVILKDVHPDVIINGSYYFACGQLKKSFHYVFDLADLPETQGRIAEWTRQEVLAADSVVAVSNSLADYCTGLYKKPIAVINNGFYLDIFKALKPEDTAVLKKNLGLDGKFIIGYAGYIGDWVRVDMIAEALQALAKDIPQIIGIFVGNAADLPNLKARYKDYPMLFTGGVSAGVETYISMFDIAIMPLHKDMFQDMAFHLKLLEYIAAGKLVVSTPLVETQRLGFRNVIFANENVAEWVAALYKARSMHVSAETINSLSPYTWDVIAGKYMQIL